MNIIINPQRSQWKELCKRPSSDSSQIISSVESILKSVREGGDTALKELAGKFDKYVPESFEVDAAEIENAGKAVGTKLKMAIEQAASNIEAFHKAQLPQRIDMETAPGVRCIQKPVPIARVGLYIPGGSAPLFSTVLMLAIPAKLAGCRDVILCTPAGKDGAIAPAVLYAASFCGIKRIFKVGGAQAIAAMAYGTESIPKVSKIFGPGNRYVTAAKQLVGGNATAIDMPAGPSEVMVIADNTANPAYVAADLLSQAEHGSDSQVMLLCNTRTIAEEVSSEIEKQVDKLGRADLAKGALSKSRVIVFEEEGDSIDFANEYGPEHLIVSTQEPWKIVERIETAGSVFVGNYSPESAGDYASGTNHTLPTCGWGHSFSGVNIESFIRRMTIQSLSRQGLESLADTIVEMADAEGLAAHANAVKIRMQR